MRIQYRYTALAVILSLVMGSAALAERGDRADLFERLDLNGDGEITRAEADQAKAERFAEADADGDGKITAEEMLAAAAERAGSERAQERAARMVERFDANEDGGLSIDEMPQRRGGDMFDRVDADGDGVITKAEAEEAKGRHGRKGGKRGHGKRGSDDG